MVGLHNPDVRQTAPAEHCDLESSDGIDDERRLSGAEAGSHIERDMLEVVARGDIERGRVHTIDGHGQTRRWDLAAESKAQPLGRPHPAVGDHVDLRARGEMRRVEPCVGPPQNLLEIGVGRHPGSRGRNQDRRHRQPGRRQQARRHGRATARKHRRRQSGDRSGHQRGPERTHCPHGHDRHRGAGGGADEIHEVRRAGAAWHGAQRRNDGQPSKDEWDAGHQEIQGEPAELAGLDADAVGVERDAIGGHVGADGRGGKAHAGEADDR